ncbi:major facilitator superfamily transporter [Cladorrhinum sp. PSN259]|nr:major facilitator superfamily transporter [Cladorrhinum sp. PSN259]
MHETTPLLQNQQQHASLPKRRLLVVFPALALIHFTSFLDQSAISTSLPAIASALDLGASVSLVGASFLITSTSIQLINGRLSDIFGRKASLVAALSIMAAGNLWSGFSATGVQLFISRAFTGFGAGAINALVQIAIADLTTLEQRGYYFGMIGMAVALGNGLGPLVGGVLTQRFGWQWGAFWFVCPLCLISIIYLMLVWPTTTTTTTKPSGGSSCSPAKDGPGIWDKLKLVDWAGAWVSLFSIALLLIPISQCGSTMSWASPVAVSMLIAGTVLFGVFLAIEWRFARLPLLPARLFQYNRSTNILIGANILIGWIYWGNLFLVPLYLQNARGSSPSQAGVLMLPMVVTHGLTSGLTGVIIYILGRYKPVIVAGAVCWVLGALLKVTHYHEATPTWQIVVVGILDGVGVGCSLQPVLVGMFAGSDPEDRAVLTGLRNFVRDMGGATGTTVSGAILSNVQSVRVRGMTTSDMMTRRDYITGLRAVFISFAVLTTLHLCACVCIRDYGLKQGSNKARPGQQKHVEEERVTGQSNREEQQSISS